MEEFIPYDGSRSPSPIMREESRSASPVMRERSPTQRAPSRSASPGRVIVENNASLLVRALDVTDTEYRKLGNREKRSYNKRMRTRNLLQEKHLVTIMQELYEQRIELAKVELSNTKLQLSEQYRIAASLEERSRKRTRSLSPSRSSSPVRSQKQQDRSVSRSKSPVRSRSRSRSPSRSRSKSQSPSLQSEKRARYDSPPSRSYQGLDRYQPNPFDSYATNDSTLVGMYVQQQQQQQPVPQPLYSTGNSIPMPDRSYSNNNSNNNNTNYRNSNRRDDRRNSNYRNNNNYKNNKNNNRYNNNNNNNKKNTNNNNNNNNNRRQQQQQEREPLSISLKSNRDTLEVQEKQPSIQAATTTTTTTANVNFRVESIANYDSKDKKKGVPVQYDEDEY